MEEKALIQGYIYYTLKLKCSYKSEWKRDDYEWFEDYFENCDSLIFSCARTNIEDYVLYKKFKAQKIYYCFRTGFILKTKFFDSSRDDILDIVGIGNLKDEVKFAPCVIK